MERYSRRVQNILESHLSSSAKNFAIQRPIFKVKYPNNHNRYQKSFLYFLKIKEFKLLVPLISCHYLNSSSNSIVLKKSFRNNRILPLAEIAHFQHFLSFEKALDFRRLLQTNHFTHMALWGISRKILSISFIWYLVVLCVTNSLVTNGS